MYIRFPSRRYILNIHSLPTRRSSDLRKAAHLRSDLLVASPGWPPHHPVLAGWHGPVWSDIELAWHLADRSEEHTSELQSRFDLVCRLLLEKKNFIVSLTLCVITRISS